MKFQVMDHTGHSTVEYSPDQHSAAMAKFNELLKSGHTAAEKKSSTPGELTQIRSLDPSVEEVVFFPPLQGG